MNDDGHHLRRFVAAIGKPLTREVLAVRPSCRRDAAPMVQPDRGS